jgi:hypothetical protein
MSNYDPTALTRFNDNKDIPHTPDTRTSPVDNTVLRKRSGRPGIIRPSSTRLCNREHGNVNHGLQNQNFYPTEYSQEISCYDEINQDKIEQVPNYVTDIYQRLYYAEVSDDTAWFS